MPCCVHQHRRNPFHHIEAISLHVQLNHQSLKCPVPIPCHVKLQILHTTGIHDVAHIQLLQHGWYLASQQVIKTCATFRLLEMFHLLSLVSKITTYNFCRTSERMSNNTGLNTPPSRRAVLMCMLIQWGGPAHNVTGPEGTKPGKLAPGINLPSDWDQVPPPFEVRINVLIWLFLYLLLICIDTNFHLKNQTVSSYLRDPGLSIGWLYFTAHQPYEDYIQSQAMDADIGSYFLSFKISTCVEFSTVTKSNTKFSKGLRYTGVVAVSYGRSEMVLPMCVRNTDKGERYANVDPLAAAAICQFSDLLWVFNPDIRITPLIPKFHEPGHKVEEHKQFSFNLAEGVGLLDGECPKWIWASHNALGNSTKTAGPGTWQDLIDSHLGFWNWVKYCCMVAIMERNQQEEAHQGFTRSLLPYMVSEWDDLCVAWEANKVPKMVLNPFCVQSDALTEDKVHKELAEEEEARRTSRGRAVHDMSHLAFMVFELCATYMPGLLQFVSETQEVDHSSLGTVAEEVQLWLPSSIPANHRGQVRGSLSDMEEHLRTAQCHDALNLVRHILHLKMWMVEYKNKNVRGQWDGTRSWAGINAIHEWALAAALKYRMAREVKLQLSGPGDWERTLCRLEDNDIRSYQDPDRLRKRSGCSQKRDGTGQTWHTLSWIWITTRINLEDRADEHNNEVLHSEWCHTLEAYALKQSNLQCKLVVNFQDTWSTALKDTPMDELEHEDDIDEDAEDEDVRICDEEDEQELNDEDFADL
ncbi:hypothetical protein EDD18DRAFT_1311691 [Armillaria luteobubalina]|uniref:CxC2-like cysteine cluster KDZ transposase-associated domain-containing protein n=1 Tax=Armillaria luteobubalina TaxID=153913 RepID=A0AA39UJM2_9AGAR|nr:hypothetical protein EDD18DRAFT_1311691 [Armillaria luteobubalina]